MFLQTRGRMTARELAAQFEVTVRTIHRDMDQLSAAGVPVYAERGRNGGFRLQDGHRTMLTGFNQSEADTLFLAGVPAAAAQLGLADALSAARLKLLAALPASLQRGAERIAQRFHLDAAAWFHETDHLPSLPLIARAVWSERLLELRYRPAGEVQAHPRKLAPLGLVLKSGVWYLIAHSGKSIRTYRVASMYGVRICDETFTRPKNFNLATHWQESVREYEAGVYREHADVRLSPVGMQRLEVLGPHVTRAAEQTAGAPDRNGWVRCQLPIETPDFGVRELMRLGDEVVVIGPPALRALMHQLARRIAREYGTGSARDPLSTCLA